MATQEQPADFDTYNPEHNPGGFGTGAPGADPAEVKATTEAAKLLIEQHRQAGAQLEKVTQKAGDVGEYAAKFATAPSAEIPDPGPHVSLHEDDPSAIREMTPQELDRQPGELPLEMFPPAAHFSDRR